MFGSVMLRFPFNCLDSEVAAFEFGNSGKGVDTALLFGQTGGPLLGCLEAAVLEPFSGDFGSASSSTIEEGPLLLSTREGASRARGGSSSLKGSRNWTGEAGANSFEVMFIAGSFIVMEVARRSAGRASGLGRIRRSACSFGLVAVDSLRASLSVKPSKLALRYGCHAPPSMSMEEPASTECDAGSMVEPGSKFKL
jgi:hypothetical protein